jgi:soluble lytic murein transglycosylase
MRSLDSMSQEFSRADETLECRPHPGLVNDAPRLRASEVLWTAPISAAEARAALAQAVTLAHEGRTVDALVQLRLVEHAAPRLRDRLSLERAPLLAALGRNREACAAYAEAQGSLDRDIAVQGRLQHVRCLLEVADKKGEAELERLVQRYPNLTGRAELRLLLAQAKQTWGDERGAAVLYRSIDVQEPESSAAEQARVALERLREAGVRVAPYTPTERIERAERLLSRGPVAAVKQALDELETQGSVPAPVQGRAHLLRARVARIEGRWDIVRDETTAAMTRGVPATDALRLRPRGDDTKGADEDQARSEALARFQKLLARRAVTKLPNLQVLTALDIAVQGGLQAEASSLLDVMSARSTFTAAARFEAAMRAVGLASDESVAKLLSTTWHARPYAVSARYHYARTLERMNRMAEAETEYLQVVQADTVSPRYYAMWAELRLWAIAIQNAQSCAQTVTADPRTEALSALLTPNVASAEQSAKAAAVQAVDQADPAVAEAEQTARREHLLSVLTPLCEAHGIAFPWLVRARDLVELDLYAQAADEIGDAYIAWRDARGQLRMRAGLEAVLTGNAPARHIVDFQQRKLRLALDADARERLAELAGELGDPGVALRWLDTRREIRPRAYSEVVERAATKYGVDPNLLFAVMRVESIYHRGIVSYAGAVGLMQIMPRTGSLIARELGVERFETSDLLDPETNVEFAAWYLGSLLSRFDGALPLAIAAYNGGPHNVRVWMRQNNPNMPLDAFLERIPFEQTHRYVRRVLTHYAAYRAQQKLPMTRLDITLPQARPDTVAF